MENRKKVHLEVSVNFEVSCISNDNNDLKLLRKKNKKTKETHLKMSLLVILEKSQIEKNFSRILIFQKSFLFLLLFLPSLKIYKPPMFLYRFDVVSSWLRAQRFFHIDYNITSLFIENF